MGRVGGQLNAEWRKESVVLWTKQLYCDLGLVFTSVLVLVNLFSPRRAQRGRCGMKNHIQSSRCRSRAVCPVGRAKVAQRMPQFSIVVAHSLPSRLVFCWSPLFFFSSPKSLLLALCLCFVPAAFWLLPLPSACHTICTQRFSRCEACCVLGGRPRHTTTPPAKERNPKLPLLLLARAASASPKTLCYTHTQAQTRPHTSKQALPTTHDAQAHRAVPLASRVIVPSKPASPFPFPGSHPSSLLPVPPQNTHSHIYHYHSHIYHHHHHQTMTATTSHQVCAPWACLVVCAGGCVVAWAMCTKRTGSLRLLPSALSHDARRYDVRRSPLPLPPSLPTVHHPQRHQAQVQGT